MIDTISPQVVVYPESDGLPMAENTRQLRWIVILYGNLAALFRDNPSVFVAADLFWYPVEGMPGIRIAPDVLIVFGRPKGDRGSYRQWEEGNVPLTVVFEILSPSNRFAEMADKLDFCERHGVEEYYVYDPDHNELLIYLRQGGILRRMGTVQGFQSPRLGIRFELTDDDLLVFRPDGKRFLSFEELQDAREQADQRAEQADHRAGRLAELSRKARRQQASAEELAELERLEDEIAGSSPG